MQLTYNFNIPYNNSIHSLCLISNNLYNQANYIVKKKLNEEKKWIRYNELDKIMKETKTLEGLINYRLLKSHTSQQILRLLDKDWTSYFSSLKSYKKNASKFKSCPRPPKFKKKNSENLLIYTNQICQIRGEFLQLSKKLKIHIPQFEQYKDKIKGFQQVRIIPHKKFYKVEIIYNYDCKNEELNKKIDRRRRKCGGERICKRCRHAFTYFTSTSKLCPDCRRIKKRLILKKR